MKKFYIWSLPTRVFHFLFALFILLTFISAEEDRWLDYHAIAGYAVLILLIFRVVWGFFGPKHSLFKDFPTGKKNVKEFLNKLFEDKQKFIGHNPLASYVMITMFIVAFLTILTGVLAFGIQEGKGILSFLNSSFFKEMELFEETHEILSSLFIVLIVAHLLGVVLDRVLHKRNETLNSIVTGYKVSEDEQSISLNIYQKIFSFLMFVIFISFLIFSFSKPDNTLLASSYEYTDYEKRSELFVSECASCHTLYPSKTFT